MKLHLRNHFGNRIRNSRYTQYFCKKSVRISLHTYFSKDIVHILFNKCLGFIAKKNQTESIITLFDQKNVVLTDS